MIGKQAVSPLFLGIAEEELHINQQVFLHTNGSILETDNKLFDFNGMYSIKISLLFDFFKVVFDELLLMELGDKELEFPKVNVDFNQKSELYNFRFCKMCYQNEIVILWTITPHQQNQDIQEAQQWNQEQLLQAEQNKFLTHLKTS